MKQELVGWQRHQLDHMQIICTLHASISSLNFYTPDAFPDAQPTVSKQKLSRNKITKFDKLYYTAKCKNVLATRKRCANYHYKPLPLVDIQQLLQAQFSHWPLIYKNRRQSLLDKELTSSKPAMMSRNRRRPCLRCLMSHSCTVATDAKHTMTRLYDCPYSS